MEKRRMKEANKKELNLLRLAAIAISLVLFVLLISLPLAEKVIDGLTTLIPVDLGGELIDVQNTIPDEADLTNVILFEKDALGNVFSYLSAVMAILALLVSAIAVVITYIFSRRVHRSTEVAIYIARDAHILSTEESLQQTLNGTLAAFDEVEKLHKYGKQLLQIDFQETVDHKGPSKHKEISTYLMYYFPEYKVELERLDKTVTCNTGRTLETFFNLEEPMDKITEKDLVLNMPYFVQFYPKKMTFIQLVNEEVFFKDKPIKKYEFVIKYVELTNKIFEKIADIIDTKVSVKDVDFSLQVELIRFKLQDVAGFKSSYDAFKSNTSNGLNVADLSMIKYLTEVVNNSLTIEELGTFRLFNKKLDTILMLIENGESTVEEQREKLINQFDQYLMHDIPKTQMELLTSLKQITDESKLVYMKKINEQLELRKNKYKSVV